MRSWPDTVSMATAGEQHSERHRNDCLVLGFAAEAEADKEQKVSRYTEKNFRWSEFQRERRDHRRQERDQQHRDQRTDEG